MCGKGKETREVSCYRKVDGKITVLDESECSRDEKPESSRSCSLRPCEGVDWVASEWSGVSSILTVAVSRLYNYILHYSVTTNVVLVKRRVWSNV